MSATTEITPAALDETVRDDAPLRGRTAVSQRALERLAVGLTGDAGRVPHREASAQLADRSGDLALTISLPLHAGPGSASLDAQSDALRERLVEGLGALADRRVGWVDIRYSGALAEGSRANARMRGAAAEPAEDAPREGASASPEVPETPDASRLDRRVLRRELHAPRTLPALLVATALLVVALAACALALPAVAEAVAPVTDVVRIVLAEPVGRTVVLAVGAVAGLALLVLGVAPGRLARRGLVDDRLALVVDDGVLADAAADAIARHCGLEASRVSVTVARRRMRARIVPTSGVPVDREGAERAAAAVADRLGLPCAVDVRVSETGAVS